MNTRLANALRQVPAYLILGLWTLLVATLILWVLAASISTTREIFSRTLLSSGLHWENYAVMLGEGGMARYLLNTLVYVGVSVLGVLAVSAPAAYALSRFQFPGRGAVEAMVRVGIGMPAIMLMIPLFMLFARLGLTGNPLGLILVYVGTTVPFSTFFLTGFFASLPRELEEAATMDGAGPIRVFWTIMLPLARPGLATVTIFNFITLFNEYFWALIFANNQDNRTLSIGLEAVVQALRYSGNWAALFAAVNLVVLPTLIFFIWQSRRIIGGVTAGAVK